MCITPLMRVISKYKNIRFHFDVDHTQIYICLSKNNDSSTIKKIKEWLVMLQKGVVKEVLTNPYKTEYNLFGSTSNHHQSPQCGFDSCTAEGVHQEVAV